MQAETRFKNRVMAFLETLPDCWFSKIQQVGIRGTPDILCCINGYFVALELKSSLAAEIAALQVHNLKAITNAGGISFISTPETWFNDMETLRELSNDRFQKAQ